MDQLSKKCTNGVPIKQKTRKTFRSTGYLRSRADSNRCRSFCRALPSRSATRPFGSKFRVPSFRFQVQSFGLSSRNKTKKNTCDYNVSKKKVIPIETRTTCFVLFLQITLIWSHHRQTSFLSMHSALQCRQGLTFLPAD